jgi:hypothetical protein
MAFELPGRATAWGIAGCALCTAFDTAGAAWTLAITVTTALAGCWDGGGFDRPGAATAWGAAGCVLCAMLAFAGLRWALIITLATALAGCYGPGEG